jgi:hypothetical protein
VDIAGDDAGVWMTYESLADARDIKRDAARRLAQRHRWRRHTGNDGFARVLVPPEWASITRDVSRDVIGDNVKPDPAQSEAVAPAVAGLVTALQATFEVALKAKDEQIARLETAATIERDRADAFRELAMKNVGVVEAEQLRNAELRVALEQSHAEAQKARQEAEQLRQAEAARRGQGRWARLRAAWRGE